MLWFKALRAFLHLRDYFCSLHPRHPQGKLSLPPAYLFYIKGAGSKSFGDEHSVCPEKQANPPIPKKAMTWMSRRHSQLTQAHRLMLICCNAALLAQGLWQPALFSMYATLGQFLVRKLSWAPKAVGGRVRAIVLQGKGGGRLLYILETTCCFSD